FEDAWGNEVLAAEILEPLLFQDNLLGFVGAEPNSTASKEFVKLELKALASQVACILNSSNRRRAYAIDEIVERIHVSNPTKYHWSGVYLLNKSGALSLESFRGEPTPHMIIPTTSGICGA